MGTQLYEYEYKYLLLLARAAGARVLGNVPVEARVPPARAVAVGQHDGHAVLEAACVDDPAHHIRDGGDQLRRPGQRVGVAHAGKGRGVRVRVPQTPGPRLLLLAAVLMLLPPEGATRGHL